MARVAVGRDSTCALFPTHEAQCWGYYDEVANASGITIDWSENDLTKRFPTISNVDAGGPIEQLAIGELHSCLLLTTGQVRCWGGTNAASMLGYPTSDTNTIYVSPADNGDVFLGF